MTEKYQKKKVLITGTAGFIGFHIAQVLLREGFKVQGIDGLTNFYDINLKMQDFAQSLLPLTNKGSIVVLNCQDGSILSMNSKAFSGTFFFLI